MAISVENHQFNLENPRVGIRNVDRLSLTRRSDSAKKGTGAVRSSGFHANETHVNTTAVEARADGQIANQFAEEEDDDFEDDENVVWEFPKDVAAPDCVTDPRDVGTVDGWIKRNPELVRLTGRHPLNCEPPLSRLMQYGFITPVSLHYVRNHGYVPRSGWEDWKVEVCGLVTRPAEITMRQLVEEFKPRELPVTLVCAGNRRKEMNMVAQTIGFNWGAASISTSVWRGARLCDVLRRCGILPKKKGALYVCFEGAETLPGGGGSKYGTSMSVNIAMDPARDVLLAYLQNGELLHPDHGFPVRMIIPGFIGGRMVKWLKRIVVTSRDSENYYHYHDNRVLPSHVDAEKANSAGWWYRPQYIINELNINSVITSPSHGESLPINSSTTQQLYTLRGYAYSGGGRKITRVEVTFDGGDTWNLCTMSHPEKPTKYGKYWCWCFWELEADVMQLLRLKEFAVRGWDESMNTQPKELTWNVMGMMNNCWFRVKVKAYETNKGKRELAFEHPTMPGNQFGGWMQQKHREQVQATLGKLSSTPAMNISANERRITVSEVEHHNSAGSAWIIVHRHVYDCTKFLQDHPGGVDSILINAGSDCTEEFDAIHSANAKAMLGDYRIGELAARGCPDRSDSTHGSGSGSSLLIRPDAPAPVNDVSVSRPRALDPKQYLPCRLIAKTVVSRDVRLFRFALPTQDHLLGLPAGKHILLSANINGKPCIRAYTPVSSDDEAVGFFHLLIKIYYKGTHPNFPAGGLMSQYLEDLPLGSESVRVKGPLGRIEYKGRGNFTVNGKHKFAKKIAMLAGGTGITPLYQIIKAILRDSQDETQMYLVYANRTEDDILLRDELDKWGKKHSNFHVWYVINNSTREGWTYSLGIMNEEILRAHIPEGRSNTSDDESTLALMCGPPPMIQFACLPNLAKMNYDLNNSCFQF